MSASPSLAEWKSRPDQARSKMKTRAMKPAPEQTKPRSVKIIKTDRFELILPTNIGL